MEDKEINEVRVKAPELGPKYKGWREENNISLEQASEISGLEIDIIQKFESGEYCSEDEMIAYHQFFLRNIPNVLKRYDLSEEKIFTQLVFDIDGKVYNGAEVRKEIVESEESEEEEEINQDDIYVQMHELGPQFKEWREESNISLEQASEITGIDIENLQKLEGGERCMFKDVMAYHAFFLEYIPNGVERYQKFLNKVLVSHGHEEIDFEDINWDDEEETDAEEVKD